MLQIGVQTKNVVNDECPKEGFGLLKQAGFSCVDFSLNGYLVNNDIYQSNLNRFFDKSISELENYFLKHKIAAKETGIKINQMHMPYPIYVPTAEKEINDYLWNEMASKSMSICKFLECPYIVVHGFKLTRYLGSEDAEWAKTEQFIDYIAPMAKEMNITICIENLYDSIGGHIVEGPCCDVYKAIERIDRINEKYKAEVLGFCFDTGHANLVGIDFESFITALGNRLKVFHIHDNDGDDDSHTLPFYGTIDWESIMKAFAEVSYEGNLNYEAGLFVKNAPVALRRESAAYMASIGKYLIERYWYYRNIVETK